MSLGFVSYASGSQATFQGVTGTVTQNASGKSYLVAGPGITIASGSSDQIVFSGDGTGNGFTVISPYWNQPSSPHADNDEFTVDGLANGTYIVKVDTAGGTVQTRSGDVDPWTLPSAGTFRSTLSTGGVLVQLAANNTYAILKAVSSPARQSEIYWGAISRNNATGATDISCRLYLTSASAGNADVTNTLRSGHWASAPPTHGMAILVNGSSTGFVAGSFNPATEESLTTAIFGARCDGATIPLWQSWTATPFGAVCKTGQYNTPPLWNVVTHMGFNVSVPASGSGTPVFGGIFCLKFIRRAIGTTKWMHG